MENRITPRADVAAATTAPRPTPTNPTAGHFSQVLSRTLVRGAETAMSSLPGSPVMAVALRDAAGRSPSVGMPMSVRSGGGPEGPLASAVGRGSSMTSGVPGITSTSAGATGATGVTGGGADGLDSSIAQSAELNIYYLKIQEAVNAQNRSFTALSNVMKAEHDTVKTAIGNIR
ncbi:MAG: hypothetical protein KC657_10265 [Myxococcales bacterium]|nr:hypothetical protein [Myxococcales bacterium]